MFLVFGFGGEIFGYVEVNPDLWMGSECSDTSPPTPPSTLYYSKLRAEHDSVTTAARDALACHKTRVGLKKQTVSSSSPGRGVRFKIKTNDIRSCFIMFLSCQKNRKNCIYIYKLFILKKKKHDKVACYFFCRTLALLFCSNHHTKGLAWNRRRGQRQSTAEFYVAIFGVPVNFANIKWPPTGHRESCPLGSLVPFQVLAEDHVEYSNALMQSCHFQGLQV